MENAGFKPIFASELNEHAMSSYIANRPFFQENEEFWCNDIEELLENDSVKLKGIRKIFQRQQLLKGVETKPPSTLFAAGHPAKVFLE